MGLSPMMQKYLELKSQYEDCILFYRLGDFYEMFFEDAKIASKELQLTLTGKDCGLSERAPMCGVPHHAAEVYINKLLENNHKVAVVEQLTEPTKNSKTLVERGIVRIITPGTKIDAQMLKSNDNNFILSVALVNKKCSLSWADVSTGEFYAQLEDYEPSLINVCDIIKEINAHEILANKEFMEAASHISPALLKQFCPLTNADYTFNKPDILLMLFARFPESRELNNTVPMISAAALWDYLLATQRNDLSHMQEIKLLKGNDHLILDSTAIKNLELFSSLGDHGKKGSLLWVLDKTVTPMGARKIKSFISRPESNAGEIERRLDAVELLKNDFSLRSDLQLVLDEVCDVERICTRIAYGTVTPRELVAIRRATGKMPELKSLLSTLSAPLLSKQGEEISEFKEIYTLLCDAIEDSPSDSVKDGGVIRQGYNKELDTYRDAVKNQQIILASIEQKERDATGIKNLKIKYNKLVGYFMEVSNLNLDKVPGHYIRKQGLATSTRFTNEELMNAEKLITQGEANSLLLEAQIFEAIVKALFNELHSFKRTANAIALTDVLLSFARVSADNNYVRPKINTHGSLKIEGGRHPVVEEMLPSSQFVPNNTDLNLKDNRFMLITGPNMAGKSTYMRQCAIITIMAHIGCFVPCDTADISLCDRIFTRVGASDDLTSGQSTFMLEMNEVSSILKNATEKSLIILDEVGRGTSTFDGLSIAWAVTEYIHNQIGAKTMFATHYHELSQLESSLDGVKNYCITAKEYGDDVIFLRKIVRGSADKSFGIAVASLAGVPKSVLSRAKSILKTLEKNDITRRQEKAESAKQSTLFTSQNTEEILSELKKIDINTLTPIEAMNILCELREKAKQEL